jgi:hypothetical protein
MAGAIWAGHDRAMAGAIWARHDGCMVRVICAMHDRTQGLSHISDGIIECMT